MVVYKLLEIYKVIGWHHWCNITIFRGCLKRQKLGWFWFSVWIQMLKVCHTDPKIFMSFIKDMSAHMDSPTYQELIFYHLLYTAVKQYKEHKLWILFPSNVFLFTIQISLYKNNSEIFWSWSAHFRGCLVYPIPDTKFRIFMGCCSNLFGAVAYN